MKEVDVVKFIKSLEDEFLRENLELHNRNRLEFLRKREMFVDKKIEELKNESSKE